MLALHGLTLFLGAALLFLVEPMFTRRVLPVLGGAPAVWTTAQLFFQVALLAGYGWAHLLTRRLDRRRAWAHVLVLLLPIPLLPLGLSRAAPPPPGASPIPWLLAAMLVTVGPPFFAVSATGPILQRWFATTGHPRAGRPYFLYAASNLGSMVGLVAYPTLIEPRLRLAAQASLWSWLYGALALFTAACAVFVRAAPPPAEVQEAPPIPRRRVLRWIALAFVPSGLMLGTTTYLTTDLASSPLLWIVPLALYLLTFILAFVERPPVPHHLFVQAAPIAVPLGLIAASGPLSEPAWLFFTLALGAFFVIAATCHGELSRDRPAPAQLTQFYFWISLGGALGSAFCALLAPVVFRTVIEHGVLLVAAAFLLPARPAPDGRPRRTDMGMAGILGAACAAGIFAHRYGFLAAPVPALLMLAALVYVMLFASPQPVHLGIALAVVLVGVEASQRRSEGVLLADRSFFGAVRVTERPDPTHPSGKRHSLFHGATLHGVQSTAPEARAEPLSYYNAEGPAGQLFLQGPIRIDARVALVGLGAGSLLSYGRPEQRWTVYEIDPLVVRIAQDPRYFTYLADAKTPYSIVLGDARRTLAASEERYSLILLDAYGSDAPPIHLLTREAFTAYLDRLDEGGILAAHISNRNLDLLPVIAGVADALGLVCLHQNAAVSASASAAGKSSAHWTILARRREDLGRLAESPRWSAPPPGRRVLWTDDYASLLQVWPTR